jgi:hypothetical protein
VDNEVDAGQAVSGEHVKTARPWDVGKEMSELLDVRGCATQGDKGEDEEANERQSHSEKLSAR